MKYREIKFRAWEYDVIQEKYVIRNFQSIQNNCGAYFFEPQKYQPNPHILMQFTGMKDKKGNDIYEGDIIKPDLYHPISAVFFKNGSWKINGKHGKIGFGSWANKVEVIGNIFENPELLNV